MKERKRRGFDNHVHHPPIRRPKTRSTPLSYFRGRDTAAMAHDDEPPPFLSNHHLPHRATMPTAQISAEDMEFPDGPRHNHRRRSR